MPPLHPRRPPLPLLGLLLSLAACPRSAPPADADAGPPDAGALQAALDAGPDADAGLDGGAAAPPDAGEPYAVRLWVGTDAGLVELTLATLAPTELEPTSRLVLEVWPRPGDPRIRLFDAADQVLDSDDAAAALDGGLRYQLTLPEPLRAGRGYTLQLDAEQGSTLLDARGRPLDDLRLGLQVRGEPGPDPAAPHQRAKKKRR